jgi:hypothetical protein
MTQVPDQRITHEDVLRVMTEVVDEYGHDYVYVYENAGIGCAYIKDGQPSCLIGHVLVRLGVEVSYLTERNSARIESHLFDSHETDHPWTPEAGSVMEAAQLLQDMGETWGEALAAARRRAEKLAMAK